jgi:hypothetical protein
MFVLAAELGRLQQTIRMEESEIHSYQLLFLMVGIQISQEA